MIHSPHIVKMSFDKEYKNPPFYSHPIPNLKFERKTERERQRETERETEKEREREREREEKERE